MQPTEAAKEVMRQWKGCELVHIEDITADKVGTDFIYTMKSPIGDLFHKRIEVKTDQKAFYTKNVVAETVLDLSTGAAGWFFTCDAGFGKTTT